MTNPSEIKAIAGNSASCLGFSSGFESRRHGKEGMQPLFSSGANQRPARSGPGPLLLYVLLEHQSSVDRWMALRMLRYVVRQVER